MGGCEQFFPHEIVPHDVVDEDDRSNALLGNSIYILFPFSLPIGRGCYETSTIFKEVDVTLVLLNRLVHAS